MTKVFGVERKYCEHKGCKRKATNIIITGIKQGYNTWVFCKEHFQKHKEYFSQ